MLNLTNNKIQDDKITNIYMRKTHLWIQIITIDSKDINLFYDNEEEYEKDRIICKDWLENKKAMIEKDRKKTETQNLILNALDTIKQVCEYYCDDCEKCPFRLENLELINETGSLCFFESALPPGVWTIIEPSSTESNEPFLEFDLWAY